MALSRLLQWLPFGRVPELSADEVLQAIASGRVQLVDVRTTAEWRQSRIDGARHLPITRFEGAAVAGLGLDPEVLTVAICLSAHRSIPAVRQLKRLGFRRAVQLRGGMIAWWRESLPTVQG